MALDVGDALFILHANGYEVKSFGGGFTAFRRRGSRRPPVPHRVVVLDHVDHPDALVQAHLDAAPSGRELLLIVRRETPALRATARTGAFAYVAIQDRSCSVDGTRLPRGVRAPKGSNYALFALARIMLATSRPTRQGKSKAASIDIGAPTRLSLADQLDVSQPYISFLLRKLPAGSVLRTDDGWVVADFDAIWDWHLRDYPGQGGARMAWQSPRSRATQEKDVSVVLNSASLLGDPLCPPGQWLESGATAVPAYGLTEPARARPLVMLSTYVTTDLTDWNYTVCAESTATVKLVEMRDPKAMLTAAAWGNPARTDPLLTASELAHEPDAHGPIRRLRQAALLYAAGN
ncbi:hypothetical protein SAMN06295909_0129 [Plantibacter sp. VKM Ac-1784]|uniref:HTH crp-type domain-containing protein n=1 Tax=Plantibacter elymi (nom. nud.) TaxID=199708 RepID=A0ABY1R764_9MICO|nr:hypothetical protein [Plantibacter sp. VKM Ac-1784]SMQ58251.1 hypothetical protein SAMN06295909_0129 [Plantibacter sp. VKM Ac-1784]